MCERKITARISEDRGEENGINRQFEKLENLCKELRKTPIDSPNNRRVMNKIHSIVNNKSFIRYFQKKQIENWDGWREIDVKTKALEKQEIEQGHNIKSGDLTSRLNNESVEEIVNNVWQEFLSGLKEKNKDRIMNKSTNIETEKEQNITEVSGLINCYFYIYLTYIDARMFAAWRSFYKKLMADKLMSINYLKELSNFESSFLEKLQRSTSAQSNDELNKEIEKYFKVMIGELKEIEYPHPNLKVLRDELWKKWVDFVGKLPERKKGNKEEGGDAKKLRDYIFELYEYRILDKNEKYKASVKRQERDKKAEKRNRAKTLTITFGRINKELKRSYLKFIKEDKYEVYSSIYMGKNLNFSLKDFYEVYYTLELQSGTKGIWIKTYEKMKDDGYFLNSDEKTFQDVAKFQSSLSGKLTGANTLFNPIKNKFLNIELSTMSDNLKQNTNPGLYGEVKKFLELIIRGKASNKLLDPLKLSFLKSEKRNKEVLFLNEEDLFRRINEFETDRNSKNNDKIDIFQKIVNSQFAIKAKKIGDRSGKDLFIDSTKNKFKQIITKTDNQDFLDRIKVSPIIELERGAHPKVALLDIDKQKWKIFLCEEFNFRNIESLDRNNNENKDINVVIRMVIYYHLYVLARLDLGKYMIIDDIQNN